MSKAKASITLWQDTGYKGLHPMVSQDCSATKKAKEQRIDPRSKNKNRSIARVRVEHVIDSTKRYRIVKDKYRLRKS